VGELIIVFTIFASLKNNKNKMSKQRAIGHIEQRYPSVPQGKNFLLGIGIQVYQKFSQLPNGAKDVEDIGRVLMERYHFEEENVKLLINEAATREEIIEHLEYFRKPTVLTENDRLLIYFSGHGLFDDGRGFWIPVNGKEGRTSSFVSNADVRDIIGNMAARHILLISDSCFSESLLVRDANHDPSPAFVDWDKKKSRYVFTSGKGVVSDGKAGENSPFARRILQQLTDNTEPQIDIVTLANAVTKRVRFDYAQQAECSPLYQVGHDFGRFVFHLKATENPEQTLWNTVLAQNTEGGYLKYLRQYREGNFAEIAKTKLRDFAEQKAWDKAERAGQAIDYFDFLEIYPDGKFADEANRRLDIIENQSVTAEETRLKQLEILKEKEKRAAAEQERKTEQEQQDKRAETQRQTEEAEQKRKAELTKFEPPMVFIKGGTFQMGDVLDDKEYDYEKPVHFVTISDFYMAETPITQAQYQAIIGSNPAHFKGDDLPVETVSWDDAQIFIQKLIEKTGKKYRLPTEAEWEYAAREGGKKVRFGNGKNYADPTQMNFDASENHKKPYSVGGEYQQKTMPVRSFAANSLGLYNMSGNVWEWCSDWFGVYSSATVTNPKGAVTGSDRVLRGGSWYDSSEHCRSLVRYSTAPALRNYYLGFRLALSL
jgi:formylglycine-generating enzyme